ncbi:MAG: aldehyde dehydrogenase family protein [Actinomycetota bacterium]
MTTVSLSPGTAYVNGEWVEGSGQVTTIYNPATEEPIGEVHESTVEDINRAVEAATQAFADGRGAWPSMVPAERSAALRRFADAVAGRRDELVHIMENEIGCAGIAGTISQVDEAIRIAYFWADQAAKLKFDEALPPTTNMMGMGQALIRKEPAGVVAAITPFNYPILLNMWKIGPALASGNTMVLKPSPLTPFSALVIAAAAHEAGLPPGVLNVVTGGIDEARALTEHPDVAVMSFTGSNEVGKQVMRQSAGTLKKVLLELGGKSPNIVFADTDIDDPMFLAALVMGFTMHAGQGCVLYTRLLVERPIYDALKERLAGALAAIKVGDPADPASDMGPLINAAQRDRVEGYIKSGLEQGATLVTGGGRPAHLDKGFYVEPTLFADVTNDMKIAREEIFGPVGVMIPFDGQDEAIAIANDTPYGLGAQVWSGDPAKAFAVAGALRAGYIFVNGGDKSFGGPIGPAPFGGYKQSGIGREHGAAGADEYMEIKTMHYPIG